MKKQIITLIAIAGITAGATMAYADSLNNALGTSNGGGIVGSKHDMNFIMATYGGTPDKDGRLCAFCHTPHHALDQDAVGYAPLWSRTVDTAKTYDQYVSDTFNSTTNGGATIDNMVGPSRLCMSCHDGTVAIDTYYGKVGTATTKGDDELSYFGSKHIAVGSNLGLSNDHPIGFVYDDMQTNPKFELKASSGNFLGGGKKISDALTVIGGKAYMTCASCHDVHNGKDVKNTAPASGRGYFLLANQTNSNLCLSCHDKNS